jgi:hypothetical protein
MGLSASDIVERERVHLLLIAEAKRGLADIVAGQTYEADAAITLLQQRRSRAATKSTPRNVAAEAATQQGHPWAHDERIKRQATINGCSKFRYK